MRTVIIAQSDDGPAAFEKETGDLILDVNRVVMHIEAGRRVEATLHFNHYSKYSRQSVLEQVLVEFPEQA